MFGASPFGVSAFGDDAVSAPPPFVFTAITLGAPIVDTASVFEDETIPAADITAGAPNVATATVDATSNFAATKITAGIPSVDSLPFNQEYALTVEEITAGEYSIPARFLWDYQEIVSENWTVVQSAA